MTKKWKFRSFDENFPFFSMCWRSQLRTSNLLLFSIQMHLNRDVPILFTPRMNANRHHTNVICVIAECQIEYAFYVRISP